MSEVELNQLDSDLLPPDVRRRRQRVAAGLFAVIAVLIAFDLVEDVRTSSRVHLLLEAAVVLAAAAGVVVLWRGLRTAERRGDEVARRAHALGRDLARAEADAARWRAEANELLQGLGRAIDLQFTRWGLTPAEREVGLLLLKGLSHKEVAQVRQTSDSTVRQQALALYRKAGISSRTELTAFFLEDLLLPGGSTGNADPRPEARAVVEPG